MRMRTDAFLKFCARQRNVLHERTRLLARRQPALIAFIAFVNALLPLLMRMTDVSFCGEGSADPAAGTFPCTAEIFLPLPGLILAGILLPMRDALFRFALPCLAGSIAGLLCMRNLEHDPLRRELQRPCAGAELRIEVTDSSCSASDTLDWLPVPKNLSCRVLAMRYSPQDEWREIEPPAECLVRSAEDLAPEFRPGYGDRYEMRGFFHFPGPVPDEGVFDYAEYLERHGIRALFRAEETRFLEEGSGFRRTLFDFRDRLLRKMTGSFRDKRARCLAAGILFGFKQGIAPELKRDFIESGTIHILTVSGTHIGLFAGILFLLFAFLPFRVRCLLVPAITFFYAMSTGMEGPAFRAFLMLTLFCLARAFLHSVSAFNSLMLAAGVLTLWNPLNLLDAGFQYSFLTVAALLAAGGFLRDSLKRIHADMEWVPAKYVSFGARLKNRALDFLFCTVLSCLTAWLASVALSLSCQGIFAPASVLANLLLLPAAWLCFAVFSSTAVLCWIPGIAAGAGILLETLIHGIGGVCTFLAEHMSMHLPFAPLWSVFAFPALLFLLLCSREKAVLRVAAAGGLAAILIFWNLKTGEEKQAQIAVFHGGNSQEPAIVISSPLSGKALAVNVPDFETAQGILGFLKRKGIRSCGTLVMTGSGKDCCAGVPVFARQCGIERLILPKPRMKTQHSALEAVAAVRNAGGECLYFDREKGGRSFRFESWDLKTFAKKDFFRLESVLADSTVKIVYRKRENGTAQITFEDGIRQRQIAVLELKNSFTCRLHLIPLSPESAAVVVTEGQ